MNYQLFVYFSIKFWHLPLKGQYIDGYYLNFCFRVSEFFSFLK